MQDNIKKRAVRHKTPEWNRITLRVDTENKNLLKDLVLQKTDTEEFLDVNKNIPVNNLLKATSAQKNKLEVTDSEYETAKSLIEVFYKEIGIVEPLNQTKSTNPNNLNQNPKGILVFFPNKSLSSFFNVFSISENFFALSLNVFFK